ncbi:MAG: O-antigen ligase family protein [Patescibacteria group bacterium]
MTKLLIESLAKNKLSFFVSVWFFLLLLMGNSFLSPYLLLFFLIGSVFFWKSLDFSKIFITKKYSLAWLLLIVFLGLSFFWTKNIPYSLDYFIFFIFSFYFFHFFLLLKVEEFDFKNFFPLFTLIGFSLIFFSLFFSFFPSLGEKLPESNLLYSSTGHNHAAVVSLFLLPISFFYFLKNGDKKQLLVVGIFSLFGFLSMGRIISIIIVLQHFFFFVFFRNFFINKLTELNKKYFLTYLKVFLVLTISFVSFWFITAVSCYNQEASSDNLKICRIKSGQSRIAYWQTAGEIIKNNSLLGVGQGNYAFFSKKYIQDRSVVSAHPHNFFLKVFAENGFLGGSLFIFIFWGLFIKFFKQSFQKKDIHFFIGLALFGVYLNSLFDYDLNFESIFILTLIFLVKLIPQQKNKHHKQFFKLPFFLTWFVCLIFLVFYIFIDLLVSLGKEKLAFNLFPYSKWHSVLYAKSKQLAYDDKQKLFSINQNNSLVLQALAENDLDKLFQQKLLIKLNEVNPWSGFYLSLSYLGDNQFSLEDKKNMVIQMVDFLKTRNNDFTERLDHSNLLFLIDKIFLIADDFYREGDVSSAGELYVLTRELDPWSLDYHQPIFIDDMPSIDFFDFIINFKDIRFSYLGGYGYDYYGFLKSSVESSNVDNHVSPKKEEVLKILDLWSIK